MSLCTRSEDFRIRWASHDVRLHHSGTKLFHHPVVGDVSLDFEAFDLPSDPGLTLTVLSAAVDSSAADTLTLLASWVLSQRDGASVYPENVHG